MESYPLLQKSAINYCTEIADVVSVDSSGEAEVKTEQITQCITMPSNLFM